MATQARNSDGFWRAHRYRIIGWSLAALLLAAPAVAMRFSDEVNWGAEDFGLFGAMLLAAGAGAELACRAQSLAYRAGAALAVSGTFLMVWISVAVGILGDGRSDLVYVGVLATGLAGAVLARFEAGGMAKAMTAMAAAQIGVTLFALAVGLAPVGTAIQAICVNAMFAVLFIGSAVFFRTAARGGEAAA